MPQDLFSDAQTLEELLTQEDEATAWREWSLLASDGDIAALLELVSENKVFGYSYAGGRNAHSSFTSRSTSRLIQANHKPLAQPSTGTAKRLVSA